jgi:hypothetical protein
VTVQQPGKGYATRLLAGQVIPHHLVALVAAKDRRVVDDEADAASVVA